MRDYTVDELKNWLSRNKPEICSIGVVGGSENDPECLMAKRLYPDASIMIFGIENSNGVSNFEYLDLNVENTISGKFDLVLCSQVLEHVWNLESTFRNLTNLVATPEGILWINCPTSNMFHGSPQYFSAGYAPGLVENYLTNFNFETLISNCVGSERLYFYTHGLQYWPSDFELAHPLLSFRPLRSDGINFLSKGFQRFLGRLFSILKSNTPSHSMSTATETYVLSRFKG